MANDIIKTISVLKNELVKLENQIRHSEEDSTGDTMAYDPSCSIALLPTLPSASEIRTRLEIRFAERAQDQIGQVIAQEVGNNILGQGAERKGGLLGEVDIVDVGEVNIQLQPGTTTTTTPGSTVIPCDDTQDIGYQDSAEETRSFWFNLEQAEIQGQKDAIKQKAEKEAKKNAKKKAEQEVRKAVCSGGECPEGKRCATIPAAAFNEPTVVTSDATYSDTEGWAGSAGSSVKGTATAQCTVTYNCPCL